MSTPNGPARRRRIAGEPTPAKKTAKKTTAKKAPAKKTVTPPVVKKAAAKKAPTSQTPVAKAPTKKAAAKKAPTPTKGPTKKPSTTKAPAADASAPEVAAADVVDVKATTEAPTTATAPAVPTARVSVPRPGAGRPVAAPPRPVAPSAPRRTLPLAVLVPLAVVTVAALAFGVVFGYHGYSTWHAKKDYRSSATQAAARAGTAAETIFSYSYTKASLSKHATESKSFMTAKFKKEFDKISPALTQLATQGDYQVKTVTRNAAPMECGSSCSPDKANILVFFDQARSKGSASPTVFGNRVVVSMKKQDGTWLVDNITAL